MSRGFQVTEPALNILARLKERLAATSDAELARFLGVDKSTISSWKARGNVPQRYAYLLDETPSEDDARPPSVWGELESAAFRLALFRFCLTRADLVRNSESRHLAVSVGAWHITFWIDVKRAKEDILAVLKDGLPNIESATTLLLTEDLSDRKAAISREYTFARAGLKKSLEKFPGFPARVDATMPPKKTP